MTNHFHETALPKFSAEARLRERQADLGVSAALLAALVGILPSLLSNAYRGLKALDNDVATELLDITQFLVEVRDALKPFRLPLTNANETLVLFEHLHEANVTPEKIRATVTTLLAVNK